MFLYYTPRAWTLWPSMTVMKGQAWLVQFDVGPLTWIWRVKE